MLFNILQSSKEDEAFIDSQIRIFNNAQVPFSQAEPVISLSYNIKEQEKIVAGINAILYCWKCLYIDVLWVDESCRKTGYGSTLLNKVENEARLAGSNLVHLDTYSFQAKDFYLKAGYSIFGILEDTPIAGSKRYYLQKKL